MSNYNNYKSHLKQRNEKPSSFEHYAKQSVQSALLNFLAHSSRPISLPISLQRTLPSANTTAAKVRSTLGKEPSEEINNPQQYTHHVRMTREIDQFLL
jgi:DNA-directed RNA polymerase specialized sigma subunit